MSMSVFAMRRTPTEILKACGANSVTKAESAAFLNCNVSDGTRSSSRKDKKAACPKSDESFTALINFSRSGAIMKLGNERKSIEHSLGHAELPESRRLTSP